MDTIQLNQQKQNSKILNLDSENAMELAFP